MQYVLASASPRRRELLAEIIKDFIICPAAGEERADKSLPPEQYALALAKAKCAEVADKFPQDTVVACDTIVVYGGKILGKPKDKADARATLAALSGKAHCVITGVCVRRGAKVACGYDRTVVRFNALTEKFICDYVESGSPMDKAGSYGIQDGGVVAGYDGSYTNVVGLPVELTEKLIKEVL